MNMKKLQNVLYVLSDDIYLALDGRNVVLKSGDVVKERRPLHLLSDIVTFSHSGASPALMGFCAENRIGLAFCKPNGKFLARVAGPVVGNILLRREQYRVADSPADYCKISRNMIAAKLHNQRQVLERAKRNHGMRLDTAKLSGASNLLKGYTNDVRHVENPEELRGIEGVGAKAYFEQFDDLILGDKAVFGFHGRSRRPPLDRPNALLSFGYSILINECASALESFGLDCYCGFLHRDRPGRKSLALDLIEELRAPVVDRFVLTLMNNRQVSASDFTVMDSGAVLLSEDGRRKFLTEWHARKKDEIKHPYLSETIPWGLLPYVQAQLLARFLRGDIDGYPPFFWR